MEEIADYNVKLDKAYTKMMSGKVNFSEATKDKPVDATNLIMCPSFQSKKFNADKNEWEDVRAADGWVNASIEDGPSSKVTSALNYEMFNDSSEIHQTLYNMPAGYYRVVYNGFYRGGDMVPAALTRRDSTEEVLNAEVYWKEKNPSGPTNWLLFSIMYGSISMIPLMLYWQILCSQICLICYTIVLSIRLPVQSLPLKTEPTKATSVSV